MLVELLSLTAILNSYLKVILERRSRLVSIYPEAQEHMHYWMCSRSRLSLMIVLYLSEEPVYPANRPSKYPDDHP